MDIKEQKRNAKSFAEYWKDKGYEKGQSQSFWLMLLRNVLGVENPETFIEFEDQVALDKSTGFIDGYIPSSRVMIEQKSIDKELNKAIKQSDGTLLTPYEQAKKYIIDLPVSRHPRWVITCNFREFHIYDMENPKGEPEIIYLKDLPKDYYRLSFITDSENPHIKKETELSLKAGEIVGELYDALSKQYHDIENNEHEQKSLNKLCVRIVFCLYAEDADLFKSKNHFRNYLNSYSPRELRQALLELFKVLNTPEDQRVGLYYTEDVLQFPYVNGGLFADDDVEIPLLTEEIKDILLAKASDDFNWSEISPTIFGAVFESTLNPETRRSGGMHYTSIENIHKIIDPLFLDELKEELEEIKKLTQLKSIMDRVKKYQEKLSSLVFMDPACGSGNFLTETYICLRKLENKALKLQQRGQTTLFDPIRVSIAQFLGIEINDFAVSVAQTALWIAESQMMRETEELFNLDLDFLPLKTNAGILEGNALRMNWKEVFSTDKINYIMGNPPFIGHQNRNKEQIEDLQIAFHDLKNHGKLDYVCGWYNKAADFMKGTDIECAFVSTNSICQGESVGILWDFLFKKGIEISFAYKSFVWNSEASDKAHVHCVIVGFSYCKKNNKRIYESDRYINVSTINGYLVEAPNIFIESRGKVLTKGLPEMTKGSQPTDGGFLILTQEEKDELVTSYPESKEFIKRYVGSREFINDEYRYCLWLKDVSPSKYQHIKPIMERIENVVKFRQTSPTESVRRDANKPMLFTQIRQPESDYFIVPQVSSENRRYIPLGFMSKDVICSNGNYLLPKADLYMFGILTSNVHNSWMRVVSGRLKSDYRYSPAVYNNFPWPTSTEEQKKKIERTAKAILDAREKYSDSSLADMYGEHRYLYPELLTAHQENDKAVMEAYGFGWKNMTESQCVSELMKMYQKLISN